MKNLPREVETVSIAITHLKKDGSEHVFTETCLVGIHCIDDFLFRHDSPVGLLLLEAPKHRQLFLFSIHKGFALAFHLVVWYWNYWCRWTSNLPCCLVNLQGDLDCKNVHDTKSMHVTLQMWEYYLIIWKVGAKSFWVVQKQESRQFEVSCNSSKALNKNCSTSFSDYWVISWA